MARVGHMPSTLLALASVTAFALPASAGLLGDRSIDVNCLIHNPVPWPVAGCDCEQLIPDRLNVCIDLRVPSVGSDTPPIPWFLLPQADIALRFDPVLYGGAG